MDKKKILIVDDEPDILRLVKFGLEKHGYDILTATNGQDAIDMARDEKPDLVLMDIMLKDKMDGIEAAGQIHSRFGIPVIYLTAHTDDEKLARAKVTAPFGYIAKPFEDRELKFAIEIGLYKAETENQLKAANQQLRASQQQLRRTYKELDDTHKELKEMQSQMVQSEKMASIGALAAGVAHEMNTPVGFVASNFETLKNYVNKFEDLIATYKEFVGQIEATENAELVAGVESIKKTRKDLKIDFVLEDIQELFDDSKEGLERVTGIIQNLRDFSRIDQAEDFDEHDLNNGIETTLVVARNEIKYDCNIKTEFLELPVIFCNSGQINQVFLNILVNAAQAIKGQEREGKGTITIKTYATEEEVVCEITDDGPGIPADKLTKIFDPFFTTKPVGKSTGLGLSVSYDIVVNKHKGKLLVDSTVEKGTTFTIKLPIKVGKSKRKEGVRNQ